MLLDTGDALVGGGLLGDATQGAVIVAGMNLMGYDAMALGPIELTLGPETLRQRMEEAEFPVLSANVVLSDTDELLAEPYAILQIGDHRVAVIGLTRVPAGPVSGFSVSDPQQAAARYVAEVATQADTVFLLTNLEYRAGLALAGIVPDIDLLIAALPRQLPGEAVRPSGGGALVVTAEQPLPRHSGRRVGRLAVTLNSDGSLLRESWSSVAMDGSFADDVAMQRLLEGARP